METSLPQDEITLSMLSIGVRVRVRVPFMNELKYLKNLTHPKPTY